MSSISASGLSTIPSSTGMLSTVASTSTVHPEPDLTDPSSSSPSAHRGLFSSPGGSGHKQFPSSGSTESGSSSHQSVSLGRAATQMIGKGASASTAAAAATAGRPSYENPPHSASLLGTTAFPSVPPSPTRTTSTVLPGADAAGGSGAPARRNSSENFNRPVGDIKIQPLGELKIPQRIAKAQQGLKRDMGMVREFVVCVDREFYIPLSLGQ